MNVVIVLSKKMHLLSSTRNGTDFIKLLTNSLSWARRGKVLFYYRMWN